MTQISQKLINFYKYSIKILHRDQTNTLEPPPLIAELHEECNHKWFSHNVLIAASSGNEKDINKAKLDYLFEYKKGDAQTKMMKAYVQNKYGESELTRSKTYNKKPKEFEEESKSFSKIFTIFFNFSLKSIDHIQKL